MSAALVSCLGEGLERVSQIERQGDAAPYRPAAKDRVGIDATIAELHGFAAFPLYASLIRDQRMPQTPPVPSGCPQPD